MNSGDLITTIFNRYHEFLSIHGITPNSLLISKEDFNQLNKELIERSYYETDATKDEFYGMFIVKLENLKEPIVGIL